MNQIKLQDTRIWKHYALESQITKSDLRSHNLGLYLMTRYIELYSHLNYKDKINQLS
jgi:hypothetical protein